MKTLNCCALTIAIVSFTTLVSASTLSSSAFDNATIQAAGPRSGASGTNFFNIEGANNGSFASYGVIDFMFASQGGSVTGINSLSLSLTESDAAFTTPGTLGFYLSTDTAADIRSGTSSLVYQTSATPPGVGTQLDTLYFLGTGSFTTTGSANTGQLDTYPLTLDGSATTYLMGVLNGGGTVRLVVAEDSTTPGIAATYAGHSNSTLAGPSLSIDVTAVPEPSTGVVLAVGVLATLPLLRRRILAN